ncbi:MAG: lysostaphin resistance A-like protein [bacterium]
MERTLRGRERDAEPRRGQNLSRALLVLSFALLGAAAVLLAFLLPLEGILSLWDRTRMLRDAGLGYILILPALIYAIRRPFSGLRVRPTSEEPGRDLAEGAVAGTLVALLLVAENALSPPSITLPSTGYALPIFSVAAFAAGPVAEEVLFRGIVFKMMRAHAGFAVGASVSSALFALSHFPRSIIEAIPYFLAGMCLAAAYERRGALIAPIFAHILANVIAFIAVNALVG